VSATVSPWPRRRIIRGVVEDLLTAAEAEHGHTIAMTAFDEYQWTVAHDIFTDTDRARALRALAEAMV
jgi:hypothetical protein